MKTLLAAMIASTAMIASAHAEQSKTYMQVYFECWAGEATSYLTVDTLSEGLIHNATVWADSECSVERFNAGAETSLAAVDSAREFMEEQLRAENPVAAIARDVTAAR